MIVLFSATLIKYVGTGPFWDAIDEKFQKPCEKHWWFTLLFVQNYLDSDQQVIIFI